MSTDYNKSRNVYEYDIAAGLIEGREGIHKFGRNDDVGTTFEAVCAGGLYNTPQVSGATTLRIKSGGNANDTAAGTGAREVTLYGLDETGALVEEAVATAGASASSATTTTFLRLFKMRVTASGTYASASAGSHAAAITIENGAGGTDWAILEFDGFAYSSSTIAAYTVPLGYTACLLEYGATVQSNKTADILFFTRENILETSAPYSPMKVLKQWTGIAEPVDHAPIIPEFIPALTDMGFMAKATTTAEVTADFDFFLVKDGY